MPENLLRVIAVILTVLFFIGYFILSGIFMDKYLHNKRNKMDTYKELKVRASIKASLICSPLLLVAALIQK